MSIERFLTQSFTQYRQVYTANKSVDTLVGTLLGHIQQTQPELVQELGITFTKAYSIWFASDVDVRVGDTLVIGSDKYSVKAIQDNTFVSSNKHFECVAERK